ncbi:zinc finger BED domain-containing protein 4-like [Corythoichthys intestinalis]|uniref:zinc finger BED domain-containing protein 4-like n=1 Tax=Corythoichthys intestinalis TaxID=161448 RepID=UPI0025A54334|nr:zinc finger BED domain-containing protein 4-like [Corythoichthys intestinalis]
MLPWPNRNTSWSATEWIKLEKLAAILEPCRYVTELFGGETYVSCSVVLPALRYLYNTMKVSDEDSTYIVRYKTAFRKDLSERKATLNQEWLKLATVLDPCFKDLKCLSSEEREVVWSKLEELLVAESNKATSERRNEPPKTRDLLFFASDSESDDSDDGHSHALSLYRAEHSVSETDCPLSWWSVHAGAHPHVSNLAKKYLASPATSVPCERIFSLAGNIIQKKRAALSAENVNRLICLSNWLKGMTKPGEMRKFHHLSINACLLNSYRATSCNYTHRNTKKMIEIRSIVKLKGCRKSSILCA